ncbi:MAG: nucleotidyltransferase domain-containing protein, partial [Bacteroidota bacterium]
MLDKDQIKDVVDQYLLDHPVVGILLVGSYARGYALESSDIDIMVFYKTSELEVPYSTYDIIYKDYEFTIEHHSHELFIELTADYRFNIGSLRMLLKVRDSIILSKSD